MNGTTACVTWARIAAALALLLLTSCGTASNSASSAAGHDGANQGQAVVSETSAVTDSEAQGDEQRQVELAGFSGFPTIDLLVPRALGLSERLGWQHYKLPGKQATAYVFSPIDQRLALSATAVSSASILRQNIHVAPEALRHIKFSWKVPALIRGADLTLRETHDSPVRVAMAFAGDRSRFSMKNAMLSELATVLTGEPLPYATLMYVWCNQCARGEVLVNPRTDRIREIVLESGSEHLGQWQDYTRDIRADFERAFGEAPGALEHVGLMTDTDNTRESTTAWYGPVSLTP